VAVISFHFPPSLRWNNGHKPKVLGVLGFDLSAAFDTLHPATLLKKLEALNITGRELSWYRSYLEGGEQCVDWDGSRSSYVAMEFGVRQGSILGPVLFLVHTADMASALGTRLNVTYADDSTVWVVAGSLDELKAMLEDLASRFTAWAKGNGLAMNAAKTQLIVSSNAGAAGKNLVVCVDGKDIEANGVFELLGVAFDRRFSTAPHDAVVAAATKQRASLISRLTHHLPRGNYLRQLALGLVCGKVSHALAAVNTPRMAAADGEANEKYKAIQVLFNNVARSIVGSKRCDKTHVIDLLKSARMPSINEMTTTALAMEAWRAYNSSDGGDGIRNPIGNIVFDFDRARTNRSDTLGLVPVPLRGHKSLVTNAAIMWNASPELRLARRRGEARRVATALGRAVPL
jgi:hypothetical protein